MRARRRRAPRRQREAPRRSSRRARASPARLRPSAAACRSCRRHAERSVLRLRRVRQRGLARKRRTRLVVGEHVHEVERMRRGRHVREVELRHLRDGVEDRVELAAEALELLLRQSKARQVRDVNSLFPRDRHLAWILPKKRAPSGARNCRFRKGKLYAACTFAAWAPLGPWTTSNCTRWPSVSDL